MSPPIRSIDFTNVHVEVDVVLLFSLRSDDDDDDDGEDEEEEEDDDDDEDEDEDGADDKKAEIPPSIWVARPDTTPDESDEPAFSLRVAKVVFK